MPSGSIEGDEAIATPSGTHATCSDACSDVEFSLVCSGKRVGGAGPELQGAPGAYAQWRDGLLL